MKHSIRLAGLTLAAAGLAGCVETGGVADGGGGTSDTFASMTYPCISQAARLTGVSEAAIYVTDRIETGGGPLLTLDAAGTPYSCRLESDGSVTVFSEFAN